MDEGAMKNKDKIQERIKQMEKTPQREEKEILACKIAEMVKDGQTIGFGSGSTSFIAVQKIAEVVQKKQINIIAVPTSDEIANLCDYYGIKTKSLNEAKLDWAFDGADEIDSVCNLIKGRGAAMFKEKLNFLSSLKTYILVDKTKYVDLLGKKCPVPIECYPGAIEYVKGQLEKLHILSYKVREKDGTPIVTDLGNYIIDAMCENINKDLEIKLKCITGVIETGLFIGFENIEIL